LVFQYSGFARPREAPRGGKYNRGNGAAASSMALGAGDSSMNPLDTITGTIITGLVLAVVLVFVIKALAGA
jgi:hypothetical protein